MNDSELLIKIRMLLEGREAASEATAAIKGTSEAATSAATGTQKLGQETGKTSLELRDLSRFGSAGTQIIQGLDRAAKGGVESIFGCAGAIRGVISAVTAGTGPIGIAVGAIGLLVGAFLALKREGEGSAEGLKLAREEAERLGQTRLDALEKSITDIKQRTDDLAAAFTLALELKNRLSAADREAQAAEREADPAISPSQRAAAAARDAFAKTAEAIDARRAAAQEGAFNAAGAAQQAAAAEKAAKDAAIRNGETQKQLVAEREALLAEFQAGANRSFELGSDNPYKHREERDAIRARAKEIQAALGLNAEALADAAQNQESNTILIRKAHDERIAAEKAAAEAAAKAAAEETAAQAELESARRQRDAAIKKIADDVRAAIDAAVYAVFPNDPEKARALLYPRERAAQGDGTITVDGKPFVPPDRPNTTPRTERRPTPIVEPKNTDLKQATEQGVLDAFRRLGVKVIN